MDSSLYRFATYNCKNVKRSIEDVRTLCSVCDIVCLQETWLLPHDIPFISTINSGFGYTGNSAVDTSAGILRGRPYGGVAILWRHSVFPQVTVLPCENVRMCAVKINTRDRQLVVICIYMPTNSNDNLDLFRHCLSEICALVNEYGIESVFILGDFNSDPRELFYRELINYCIEQNLTCIDTEMLGIDSGNYTYISQTHGSCTWLDHCLITQSARQCVTNVHIKYDTMSSDHLPLIVECNLNILTPKMSPNMKTDKNVVWGYRNDEQIAKYTNECNKLLKIIDFPIEFASCADYFCGDSGHRHILDKMYSDIVTALRDAAMKAAAERRGAGAARAGGSRISGWNKHIAGAHRVARSKFREWVLCGRPKSGCVYNDMCESRRVFKSRLKWCQDHQEQVRMDALAERHRKGDFRGFWQSTNKINVRPGLPASVGGVSEPREIANVFRKHFTVQSPRGPAGEVLNADRRIQSVGTRFYARDVSNLIKSMTRGKSPGHDGLSIEHLLYAGPHISRILAMFYSLCVSHCYLPADFMKTVVVPIVKNKTGDLGDANNYRPISLATIAAKVFDGLLDAQINKYVALHDNQFGFRPNLSTESAILCLKHTINYYTKRKTPVFACFLDLSKAFDLVSYDVLWGKLKAINLPGELTSLFQFWYGHQQNCVRWAGAMSEQYRLQCGVRQGGLTSPTLFNIYMNDLIVALSSRHVGCHVDGVCVNNLSYADDMVLLSASVCGLRKLLKVCEEYASEHGLCYNVKKSKFMVFGAGLQFTRAVPPICLNEVPLDRVDNFKYLGHVLTTDLRDHEDMERERRSLSIRANMLARRFARCSKNVKISLFKAYCTSLYTCSLWAHYTQKSYSDLRVLYNNAFRIVVGLPRFCSASGMFAEARTDCFHTTMRKRSASLVRRVRASSNAILAMIASRLDCPYMWHCGNRHAPVQPFVRGY